MRFTVMVALGALAAGSAWAQQAARSDEEGVRQERHREWFMEWCGGPAACSLYHPLPAAAPPVPEATPDPNVRPKRNRPDPKRVTR
jgi:hypothetical protein